MRASRAAVAGEKRPAERRCAAVMVRSRKVSPYRSPPLVPLLVPLPPIIHLTCKFLVREKMDHPYHYNLFFGIFVNEHIRGFSKIFLHSIAKT
jgi:hypothetical protein